MKGPGALFVEAREIRLESGTRTADLLVAAAVLAAFAVVSGAPELLVLPLVMACGITLHWLAGAILMERLDARRSGALAASLVGMELAAIGLLRLATVQSPAAAGALAAAILLVATLSVMNLYRATVSEAISILYLSFLPCVGTHLVLGVCWAMADR